MTEKEYMTKQSCKEIRDNMKENTENVCELRHETVQRDITANKEDINELGRIIRETNDAFNNKISRMNERFGKLYLWIATMAITSAGTLAVGLFTYFKR